MKTPPVSFVALFVATIAFAAEPKPDAGPAPSEAETKAVAELGKLGIDVRPIAAGINWRSASVRVAGGKADPKIFGLLKDVASLQELDLAGVQLTDADLAQLAGLSNLRVLHLEKTPTTDPMLAHLKGLKNLSYLNVYGTPVTDAGLPQLKELANLKSLYVFETKVTDAGIAALKAALPNVRIVKGWTAEDIAKLTAKAEEKKPAPAPAAAPDKKAVETEIAEAQKKLDGLNAEIAKRRETRAKHAAGTPEYEAENKKVQEIKPDIAKATAAVEAAKAKLTAKAPEKKPAPPPDTKAVEAEIADAQKKVDGLNAELAKATAALAAAKAKLTAKVEEKKPAPPPDNKAIEGEIAAAQKTLDGLNAEIAKRSEARAKLTAGTPEYEAEDKKLQEIKPEIEKATVAVAAAKAKLKKP